MDSRTNVQHLFEQIKDISEEAAHILREAVPNHQDILTLTMEDLNALLQGECNLQVQKQIMGLINEFLQELAGQSMDSVPADVMKAVSYGPDILTSTREDLNKLLPGARNFQFRRHVIGVIKEFSQEQARQSMDSTPNDAMKAVPYDPDILTSIKENLNELLPGKRNLQVRSHFMGLLNAFLLRQARQSVGSSPADVIKYKPVIMVFMHHCHDPSHMTNDNCLTKCQPSSDDKVHIFHCTYHDSLGLLECQENEQAVNMVHAILQSCADSQAEIPQSSVTCTQQDMEQQPITTKNAKTLNITKAGELHRGGPKPAGGGSESEQRIRNRQSPVQRNRDSTGHSGAVKVHITENTSNLHDTFMKKLKLQTDLSSAESSNVALTFCPCPCQTGTDEAAMSRDTESSAVSSPGVFSQFNPVKVHMLVAGETFQAHETFIQKLNLQIELCSAESSNVILVFCPVVSQIGTDMDAAMARVTENKPVILVFMHYCHDPSHMTNITVQPSGSNILQVVHCAFPQYKGLLECQENEQAVKAVRSTLLRFVDSHDEVQQQMATQGDNTSKITNDNELNREGSDPVKEENESVLKMVPAMERSTGLSGVKVHMLTVGETFNTHNTFMKKLNLKINPRSAEKCNVILVFCPVVSRIGTDMEAAMARVTEEKPVILVFMHHCHNPRHMTNITVQPSRGNIVQVVHCAFHQYNGLLECQENEQAVKAVRSTLLRFVDSHDEVQQQMATQGDNTSKITNDNELNREGSDPVKEENESVLKMVPAMERSTAPSGVKVRLLVAGQTFQTHDTIIQKLKLQIELCSAESSNVILVFCPVVSHIRTDMEAAMARVTVNKPVILVFMHHCHDPSHMTNITVQPSRSNIVQVVHCAFHETKGLLQCQENEEAVKAVRSTLLRCVDVQAEVPLTQSVMEQQPMGTQNAKRPKNTNDSEFHRQSTESVETPLVSKTRRFSFSKPNWNVSLGTFPEISFPEISFPEISFPGVFSRSHPNPNRLNNSSLLKVHMLVAGETFKTHDTFMQKLKLQIQHCSAESSNVILVFCPVVSHISTDMEAAMARVTEDKPVILVFMHHCHDPSHMTNITAQPSMRNIVQVVHCAYHETKGLLECRENEQAVADVQAMLKKHK